MTAEKHRIHFVFIIDGKTEEGIVPLTFTSSGRIAPRDTIACAAYVYDLDARIMLKNRTQKNFYVPLGVPITNASWLVNCASRYKSNQIRTV